MNHGALVRLARPHQYTKNLVVFAAPGAAGLLFDGEVFGRALAGFVVFCLISSVGYVVNDIRDVDIDRRHPSKRRRPIAAGQVTLPQAKVLVAGLVAFASLWLPYLGPGYSLIAGLYVGLTLSYSSGLKHVPWLELTMVSSGFVLRALAGGFATDIPVSSWFLVVVSASALLMIIGKRTGEIHRVGAAGHGRPVLDRYRVSNLRAASAAVCVVAVGAYVGWALDQSTGGGTAVGLLTVLPFGLSMLRFLQLSWGGRAETPELLIVRDPTLVVSGFAWLVMFAASVYA